MNESCWLLEAKLGDTPIWYRGTDRPVQWTTDVDEAVQFRRERDAEAMFDAMMFSWPDVGIVLHKITKDSL